MPNDNEKIRQRAYEIWNRDGRQDGQADDHWLQAERELGGAETGVAAEQAQAAQAPQANQAPQPNQAPQAASAPQAKAKKKLNGTKAPAQAAAAETAKGKKRGAQPASQG